MITIDTSQLVKAVDDTGEPHTYLAALSRSTRPTFNKVIGGGEDVNLRSMALIANFLGLDIHITYKKRKAEKAAA